MITFALLYSARYGTITYRVQPCNMCFWLVPHVASYDVGNGSLPNSNTSTCHYSAGSSQVIAQYYQLIRLGYEVRAQSNYMKSCFYSCLIAEFSEFL